MSLVPNAELTHCPKLQCNFWADFFTLSQTCPQNADAEQFSFGKNWKQFIEKGRLSAAGLLSSVRELRRCAGGFGFEKLKVLDLGCGSGLSSLAFRLLGAESVLSADVQSASLDAAQQLRQLFNEDEGWQFVQASALDARSLAGLGQVDIVYTWGVLHHTGDVWQALHNAQLPLADDGLLLAAVYAEEFYDEQDHILLMKQFYRNASARLQQDLEIAIGTGILPLSCTFHGSAPHKLREREQHINSSRLASLLH